MPNIKKVMAHLDAAESYITTLRQQDPNALGGRALDSLYAALRELAGIVRTDHV
jgi:hypothetical protein